MRHHPGYSLPAIALAALALAGCHLIFTYEDREPDAAIQKQDVPRPDKKVIKKDAPRPDKKIAKKDAPRPDRKVAVNDKKVPDRAKAPDKAKTPDVKVPPPDVIAPADSGSGKLTAVWAKRYGGTSNDYGNGVAVGKGGVCLVGDISGTAYLDTSGPFTSKGSKDILAAKISTSGKIIWVSITGNIGMDYADAVAMDSIGSCVTTGVYTDTVTFGTGVSFKSLGSQDVFLTRRAPASGLHQKTLAFGGTYGEYSRGVALSPSGNIYVTGGFQGTVSINGSTSLNKYGQSDVFLVGFKPQGMLAMPVSFGGSNHDFGESVAVDSKGYVNVAGSFRGTASFDGGTTTHTAKGMDAFVASYRPTGKLRWVKVLSSTGNDTAYDVTVDQADNVYVTGYFTNSMVAPGQTLVTSGSSDIFLVSYAQSGAARWATRRGGIKDDHGQGVAVHGGVVYLAGRTNADVLVASHAASTGAGLQAYTHIGQYWDEARDIAADSTGVYVVGNTSSPSISFGSTTLTSTSPNSDIFLVKFKPQ